MIRNLKTLGIALAAMLALSAVAASAASAQQGVLTSDGPVTLTGTETGPKTNEDGSLNNAFTSAVGDITCEGSTYTGHKYNATPHELIPNGATTITVTPQYVNCEAHVFFTLITVPATVKMNGCDYVFHSGQKIAADTYGVSADLVCPENKAVEVEVFEGQHKAENRICTVKVKGQSGLSGPHLTHTTGAADDVDLVGTFTKIHEEHEGSGCGTGTSSTAKLDVDITIKGHNNLGESTPVTISDEA